MNKITEYYHNQVADMKHLTPKESDDFTLMQTAKWLREEKGIDVLISKYGNPINEYCAIVSTDKTVTRAKDCPVYEDALAAGIEKAFEMLRKGVI